MSRLPPIIGITGKAGAGKDTLALHLQQKYGYTRRAFADPIKELLNRRFGWTADMWNDREWKEAPSVAAGRLLDEGRRFCLDKYLSPRQLAQWLGSEVGRDTFGPDCWVEALHRWFSQRYAQALDKRSFRLVVPDVRFDNEARWIERQGGIVIGVERPGAASVAAHVSEAGVSSVYVPFTILNNSTIDKMTELLDMYLEPMYYG